MSDAFAAGALAGLRRRGRWRAALLAALAVAVAAAFLADLSVGASGLTLARLADALLRPGEFDAATRVIVWNVRLPQALMAVMVGAALALAGAEMQTILDNPLASPFTLGVSSAAALGAALAIVLGLSLLLVPAQWMLPANAFVFAFASVLLLQFLAAGGRAGSQTVVLFGIALVFLLNAAVAFLQFVAAPDALQALVFWGMGSLARSAWDRVAILAVVLVAALPMSFAAAPRLTLLRFGEDRARSLGVDVARLRFLSLLRVSLLASVSVAFVGTVGFVGLVGPHLARLSLGEDHRFFLPGAALYGALLLSLSAIAAKTVLPGVLLPIGIVTALVGVPFFMAMIFGRSGRGS